MTTAPIPQIQVPIHVADPQSATTGTHGQYLSHGTLRNGLRVATRPLAPSDRPAIESGFTHLSDQSRYSRFLVPKPQLTRRDLDLLMGDLSQDRQVAVVLVWPRSSCDDIVLGVAHAIRLRAQPDTADVAITTADEIHGQGGGRLLMRALADRSLHAGIVRFSAAMLATNTASYRLLAGVGEVETHQVSQGLRELTVVVRPGSAAPPATLAA